MEKNKNLQNDVEVETEFELNNTPSTNENSLVGTTKPNSEAAPNGMFYGVLVLGALLIKRGSRFVQVTCPKQISDSSPVQQGMWSVSNPKPCSDNCVMFNEPIFHNDGTAEITICDKTLKFNKLIDLRGGLEGINITTGSREEIVQWLIDNHIVST